MGEIITFLASNPFRKFVHISYSCFSSKFATLIKVFTMQLFYVPGISGSEIILDETESKHVVRVLRLGKGDSIFCTDGTGGFYTALITDANPKKCRLSIIESSQHAGEKNYYTHIAIAPTKNNDRLEWFLEKATEIGVDEISLILCENSERRTVKTDRLEKVLISAMKQSVKAYLPKLNEPVSFNEFIAGSNADQKFIAHCRENNLPHMKGLVQKENLYSRLLVLKEILASVKLKMPLNMVLKPFHLATAVSGLKLQALLPAILLI
jgi:16S rRNA (uracil1498-N3)-methyltransferase